MKLNKSGIFLSLLIFAFFSPRGEVLAASKIFLSKHGITHELEVAYEENCQSPSDINEHLPVLRELAKESSSIVEIGVRNMVSTWGILRGLAENPEKSCSYTGIDLFYPPSDIMDKAKRLAQHQGISFKFLQANDMDIMIEPADMLFIDSLHTYCHLTYELEKFSPMIRKYIAMHDTSDPWGERDDNGYFGDYSEYSPNIDRIKKGLWPAVVDFLERHPEWSLYMRRLNNHGFTVLKRNSI